MKKKAKKDNAVVSVDLKAQNAAIVKQLDEEMASLDGLREFVNKGADALAARLLGGQNLYTDNMVEILRKRLTIAWEQSRVLMEYRNELENFKGVMVRQQMMQR